MILKCLSSGKSIKFCSAFLSRSHVNWGDFSKLFLDVYLELTYLKKYLWAPGWMGKYLFAIYLEVNLTRSHKSINGIHCITNLVSSRWTARAICLKQGMHSQPVLAQFSKIAHPMKSEISFQFIKRWFKISHWIITETFNTKPEHEWCYF